jgi:acetaldehyde dehydrogenase (acetylating)
MLQDKDLIAIQEARAKVEAADAAWAKFKAFSQQQVDAVVEAVAEVARSNARRLAEMAVEETGMGNVKDKIAKNLLNADLLPRRMRGLKTVGILREIPEEKVTEIGVPVGVVAAIIPTTNPTSTVIFKTLISLKAGNAVVLSPHPRAKNCTCYSADLLYQAAVKAGAPEGIIQCLQNVSLQSTQELMRHPKTAIILATGGHGLVKAAYSSGKPALGVGPGNVPVLLEKSADVADAVAKVVDGKSFDYGTVCSSEQTLLTCRDLKPQVIEELRKNRAYIANEAETEALSKLLITSHGTVAAQCVGKSPTKIARMAGFEVPPDTSIIAAEIQGIGPEYPLSREKLSPVLALHFGEDFYSAMDGCEAILRLGGLGHTCVIFSKDESRIREFGLRMPAFRVLVNTAAPQGSVGITTNIWPSMTLGCGAAAGNSTSDNVGPQHLINIKRVAHAVRRPEEALSIPGDVLAGVAETPAVVAAAPVPAANPALTRQAVEAVVERYLRDRGVSESPQPTPTAAPTAPVAMASNVASLVVDQFLSGRRTQVPAPSGPTCGCSVEPRLPVAPAVNPAEPEPAPEPPIRIVDFVCERDVRLAIEEGRKIFIGPKSIVTPSARETASQSDTIVLAERK